MANHTFPALILIAAFAVLSFMASAQAPSSDLLATWLAGHFYAEGALDQIYPADSGLYTMLPPSGWVEFMTAQGYSHDVFPFIYPPLWAWVAQFFTDILPFHSLARVASLINPALIGGMVFMAWRTTRSTLPSVVFVSVGIVAIAATNIGQVALRDNQPQILVSFLTVWALSRLYNEQPRSGGAVMALAAALKLTPAFYALLWVTRRKTRALIGFTITGAALAGLSVLVAGWPLHATFLHQIGAISDTVFLSKLNFSIDPVIAQLCCTDAFLFIDPALSNTALVETQAGGWYIMAKPPLWSALSGLALVMVLAGCTWLAAKSQDDPLIWPVLMITVSLISPLSWVYHYLAPAAFAPVLLDRFGQKAGTLTLLAVFAPLSLPIMAQIDAISPSPLLVQGTSLACLTLLATAFVVAILRKQAKIS
ncbi:glycosyltransferase family 87 protein [Aestuariibius sp. HNIBRBA575]|uniref:glycosyltransferase family 87 protein n=1 Tax=Aestuariibius sp. HNIBRBA575 TaxID=3233343 RepID=UPI0034A0EDA0